MKHNRGSRNTLNSYVVNLFSIKTAKQFMGKRKTFQKKKGAKKKHIKMEERNLNLKKAYIQLTHTLKKKKKNLLKISF